MQQYLLSLYQPDGDPPPPEFLEPIMRELAVVNREMREAGAWVFDGGLHAASSSTVVRVRDGEMLMTDGPYTEGKEHIGGFVVVRADDLDGALEWARRIGAASGLPIEVRPFKDLR
ncbi:MULTISPECIES: YciI family protein [unclassified Nonomuraea]|uniref:YciI family protein n=1 Tax=unclassified Nonomuraea TaxID=2593643 RepID=UPI0033F00165